MASPRITLTVPGPDGDREVAVWLYPNDPDLPGLARAGGAAAATETAAIASAHPTANRATPAR